jgi:hypothetical protein
MDAVCTRDVVRVALLLASPIHWPMGLEGHGLNNLSGRQGLWLFQVCRAPVWVQSSCCLFWMVHTVCCLCCCDVHAAG